jgi:hypothetical protein
MDLQEVLERHLPPSVRGLRTCGSNLDERERINWMALSASRAGSKVRSPPKHKHRMSASTKGAACMASAIINAWCQLGAGVVQSLRHGLHLI